MAQQMTPGLVTTVIPVFNRPTLLKRAVQSVLDQTYRPLEVIIVDDGSTDNTLEVAARLANENSEVTVLSIKNSGPGVAREAGRQAANGEYIQYLDSDDILLPSKFEKQVAELKQNPTAGACYCKTEVTRQDGGTIGNWKRTGETISHLIPSMLGSRWWDTSTPLYTRNVTDEAGPWKPLINEEDWEYDCRIGYTNGELCYVPEVLSVQYAHNESRLSQDGAFDPVKLQSRARARESILDLSLNHPSATSSQEYYTLLKYTFLLARQCGSAGLKREAKCLFSLVDTPLADRGYNKLVLNIYRWGGNTVGFVLISKLFNLIDRFKP
jgi:glycosyltransferase involved in cell wall biosynthesis